MTRRAFLCVPAAIPGSDDEFEQRILRFNAAWGKFFRRYYGCPAEATVFEECKPHLGQLERKLLARAGERAREVWPS